MLQKIDYLDYLKACWLDHLKSKPDDAPTVVSTFAGCGGSSLGYSMAGYRERLAVEWDQNAVDVFKLNFPDVMVHQGDITRLTVSEALSLANLRQGELDVFDGSPPCQGFSIAGSRQLDDPRNQLFREYVRLLRGFMPKVFLMENVSGMVRGVMRLVFVEILKELKASGYKVSARLMNVMYFGVPQHRTRMIFIGVRDDLGIEPTHPKALMKPIAVKEALGLNGYGFFTTGKNAGDKVHFDKPSPVIMKAGIDGSSNRQFQVITDETTDPALLYLPAPAVTGKTADIGFSLLPGQNGSDITGDGWQSLNRPPLDGQSGAIMKEGALWGKYPSVIHPTQNRGVSIGELRRLSSFPDDFQFLGKWVEAWARIGNSVPPLFMRALAQHVQTEILNKANVKDE